MISRNQKRIHRKRRTRAKISGTADVPRVSIFRSNKHLYVQFVDDEKGNTLFSTDSRKVNEKKFNVETAKEMGKKIADEATKGKIKEVVFDKSGYKYHGKVKALAEGMREKGLKF
ncbi:MAG: 50S ribosomal protein L18 [Candidatus Moraniibacteriota bacterium]